MKRFVLLCVAVALLAPATADATFPGANGKIAFVRDGDIWTMNPDGTGQVNLTNSAADEQNPAWSPDGNRIAFDRMVSGFNRQLHVMFADGTGDTPVTTSSSSFDGRADPAWSPDGTKLVFIQQSGPFVATVDLDGTGETTIWFGEDAFDPEWSPDGTRIAFTDEAVGSCFLGIAGIDPDGSDHAPLVPCVFDNTVNQFPTWSPDGTRVAFTTDHTCSACAYYLGVIDSDGTNRMTLTSVADPIGLAWSPDGSRLAYGYVDGRIKTVNPDGTGIVDVAEGAAPDWQPLNEPGPEADVLATITDSPDPVAAGGILTYTAQAKNLVGPDDASAVTLTLNLPSGVFFVSATPTQGSCSQAAGVVSCNLGSVPEGTSATVSVAVEPQNPLVTLNATATVGAAEPDPIPSNNSASASTTVTYGAYARPKGATPSRFPLVPAYRPCEAAQATLTHGPPLAHPSCGSPVLSSGHLTVGTPDANGAPANSAGFVKLTAIHEPPPLNPNNGDQDDVGYDFSLTDVRNVTGLTDYTGELRVQLPLRLTDRDNSPSANAPATMSDTTIEFDVPCSATANPNAGSTCAVSTTAEALLPGLVKERKRALWQLGKLRVLDGGSDGDADTGPNTLFAAPGLFVP